jgi:hypothetical protein
MLYRKGDRQMTYRQGNIRIVQIDKLTDGTKRQTEALTVEQSNRRTDRQADRQGKQGILTIWF